MIAVWSTSYDSTATRVQKALEQAGSDVLRIDTDRYGSDYLIDWDVNESLIEIPGRGTVRPNNLDAIYYRRPALGELPKSEQDFSTHESWYFVRGVLIEQTSAFWMNHPVYVLRAENKLRQLAVAKSVGLKIPATKIPASAHDAFEFFISCDRQCICKPGYAGILDKSGEEPRAVYTWKVPRDYSESNFENVIFAPTLLQKEVNKQSDIRVTVSGNRYSAIRITDKGTPLLDWRVKIEQGLTYEEFLLDPETEKRLMALMERFNLSYAAVDFAQEKDGNLIFLELNPAGQWEWLEEESGAEISKMIAETLLEVKV